MVLFMLPSPAYADPSSSLHPKKIIVDGVEGVWFAKEEAVQILDVMSKAKPRAEIDILQTQAIELSQRAVATSSAAFKQDRFALDQTTALYNMCRASLVAETERCESVWHQPTVPFLLGAATCVGLAYALPQSRGSCTCQ